MCTVYLIHFDKPIAHARHYLGYTANENLEQRLSRHKSGNGARLLQVANQLGVSYKIVRIWDAKDWKEARKLERRLKLQKNSPRLCPVCKGDKL